MSMDTVDDLHYAEDCLGRLASEAAEAIASADPAACLRVLGSIIAMKASYCRPTCQALEEGECQDGDPTCGCFCHEGEVVTT